MVDVADVDCSDRHPPEVDPTATTNYIVLISNF